MAKLSARGRIEIGRIEFLVKTKSYFTNGDILVNYGYGWKQYSKVKTGLNPQEVYQRYVQKQQQFLKDHPLFAEYERLLHKMCGLCNRSLVHTAISSMPDDPDGIWSEFEDSYMPNKPHLSFEEIAELCKAYKAMEIAETPLELL
jgi:hypothetical protein